jgi:ABC-type uncharacterized transport system substrate-binding protein
VSVIITQTTVIRRVAAKPAGAITHHRAGGESSATLAMHQLAATIPIVFGIGDDPVRLGLVASLARPGGNATGINFFGQELVAKNLALMHELVPKAVRVAVLLNPANVPPAETTLRQVQEAARATGLQIQVLNASTISEIDAAFATLAHEFGGATPIVYLVDSVGEQAAVSGKGRVVIDRRYVVSGRRQYDRRAMRVREYVPNDDKAASRLAPKADDGRFDL